MEKIKINSFQDYLDNIETIQERKFEINLFRGQSDNSPLLPSISRENPRFDTTDVEIKMLKDLQRRSPLLIKMIPRNDWEWLVLAQHFGLKTRLLDWSSNPLVALWFACSNEYSINKNSFVYILSANNDMLVDLEKNVSPFTNDRTKILRPTLNNERIVAQSGWFTAHRFSRSNKKFVTLETHRKMKSLLVEFEIPAKEKKQILKKLSIFGVNNRTIYPDINGACLHLNWKYKNEIINGGKPTNTQGSR
jgi:hypothetical protein